MAFRSQTASQTSQQVPCLLRPVSLAIIAAVLSFLFDFGSVSSHGHPIASISGAELLTGTSFISIDSWGYRSVEAVDVQPLALTAVLASIAGLLSVFAGEKSRILVCISATISAASMLMLLVNAPSYLIGGDPTRFEVAISGWSYGALAILVFVAFASLVTKADTFDMT